MAKGWKQVNGTWYYFNDYGAAVVKIWLKSGGKWYFMQVDGTMAKNRWIKWYNKWYYVDASGAMYANRRIQSSGKWYYLGSDGAMYTSRYTPDGYWVNANGVWENEANANPGKTTFPDFYSESAFDVKYFSPVGT